MSSEIYYRPLRNEVEVFEKAHTLGLPVMLKGPTGCGKSRFVRYMAERLHLPLVSLLP